MQLRHRLRLLAASLLFIPSAGIVAPLDQPGASALPRVTIDSVGVAREAGWAVLHLSTSAPLAPRVGYEVGGRVIAEFPGAVLAPNAAKALEKSAALRDFVSITESLGAYPLVRLVACSARGDAPSVERFADGRGLIVRVPLLPASPQAPPLSAGQSQLERATLETRTEATVRLVDPSDPRPGVMVSVPQTRCLPPEFAGALSPSSRALVALAFPWVVPTLEPRSTDVILIARQTRVDLPGPLWAARPEPLRDALPASVFVRRLRIVELQPLTVAIDCSQAPEYELMRLEGKAAYRLFIRGARIDPRCEQTLALHPAMEAAVSAEEVADGVIVTVPVAEGQTCRIRPGAAAGTLVCEVIPDGVAATQPPPTPTPPTEAPDGEPIVNLDFQEAPIVEILTALAKYANRNVVTTTAVSGTMSLHLSGVTLTEALDVITKLNDLEYTLIGDRNYIVGTAEEIARFKPAAEIGKLPLQVIYTPTQTTPDRIAREMQEMLEKTGVTTKIAEDTKSVVFMEVPDRETAERLQKLASEFDVPPADTTRWVQLEHLTPKEAASALEGLVTNVNIRLPGPEAPQVNVIGLEGKTVDVDRAEGLLAAIDVERPAAQLPAAELVSRTLVVSYVDPEQVVQVIGQVFGEQVQAVLVTATEDLQDATETEEVGGLRPAGRILVRAPEGLLPDVERLVRDVDAPPPQVQITATITDVRVDREKTVGFQWELPGLTFSEERTAGNGFQVGKISRSPFNATGSGSFMSTFEAILTNTNTTILSRTTLIAMEGKTANFLVGDIIPYETAVAGDGTITTSVEFEEIGLGLKFAPTVDAEENITLFISPRVRGFSGFSPQGYPIVATREASTILRCRDGDMVVIGGLLRDEEIKSLSGIPFLKDLPFFGELFKKRQTQKRKSEVVVFAEVKLLRPDQRPAGTEATTEMGQ